MPKVNKVQRTRAKKAAKILELCYDGEDLETSAMDLLADIFHLCTLKDYDIGEITRRAQEHETSERLGIE